MSKRRLCVAFVDYVNLIRTAQQKGKKIDWSKLIDELSSVGEVLFAFVYVPDNYLVQMPNIINLLGFRVIYCPNIKQAESDKLEDTVDAQIIIDGISFSSFKEITDFVVVSDDHHMGHLVGKLRLRGKKVHGIGSAQMSRFLKEIIDPKNISQVPTD